MSATTPQTPDAGSSAPPRAPRLKRALLVGVELAAVGGISWVLFERRTDLAAAFDLDITDALLIFLLCGAAAPVRGLELTTVTRALGVRMPFVKAMALSQAATLLNYLPMQAGTVLRARVLKTEGALSYARYLTLMSSLVLLGICAAAAAGLAFLSATHTIPEDTRTAALLAFCVAVAAVMLIFLAPVERVPLGTSWLGRRLRDVIDGWQQIRGDRRSLLVLGGTAAATPVLLGLRYFICFGALSLDVPLAESLLLGAAVLVSVPINITPGGLGVRELVGTAVGAAAGLGVPQVLAAVTIDRVISLLFSLVAGGSSLAWLRRQKVL